MKSKTLLSASVICSNFSDLKHDIDLCEKGSIDQYHLDFMDGHFVPRLGLFPEIITTLKQYTKKTLHAHLMISNPIEFIPLIAQNGVEVISIHVESTPHINRALKLTKDLGCQPAVAINPGTPLSCLDYLLDDIKLVLLMGINPGIVGHKIIPSIYQKINDLKKIIGDRNIQIEIDGGVSFESAAQMAKYGADILVCGTSTIFNQQNSLDIQIKQLKSEL